MKIAISVFVLLVLGVGAAGGIYAWKRLNRIEPRGVELALELEIPAERKDEILEDYNEILDEDEVLRPVVEGHGLVGYYEAANVEAAVERLRKDSYVEFPRFKNQVIHILFDGKRKDRSIRDNASRDLAAHFLQAIEKRRQATSGGL
ncbi:MAG: hypothetical protein Q7Q71_05770 [Verrucomicrobiota bacterium JB023]|nr:hypothetical protein [Verrucomicrobiota bacterium JB023]